MKKIYSLEEIAPVVAPLIAEKQKIVLTGGCFDIVHTGHIAFLTEAKKQGDTLIVLLEHDASIRARKGRGRPVNTQHVRSQILSTITSVDYIITLPHLTTNQEYDNVVLALKPAIIATTKGDSGIEHKKRQAESLGAKVKEVIDRLPEYASSQLVKQIPQL